MRAILGCGLAAMLVFTAGLSADDKKEEKLDAKKLVGKWEPAEKKEAGIVIEFVKGGKVAITAKANGMDIKVDGTWKLNGNKLDLALAFGGKEKSETLTVLKLTDEELTRAC